MSYFPPPPPPPPQAPQASFLADSTAGRGGRHDRGHRGQRWGDRSRAGMTRMRGNTQSRHASHFQHDSANHGISGRYGHRFLGNANIPVQKPYFPSDMKSDFNKGHFPSGFASMADLTASGSGINTWNQPFSQHPLPAHHGGTCVIPGNRGHLNPNFFAASFDQPALHKGPRESNDYDHQRGDVPSQLHQRVQSLHQGESQSDQRMPSMQPDGQWFRGKGASVRGRRGWGRNPSLAHSSEHAGRKATRENAAPAVPSFGASVPLNASSSPQHVPQKPNPKKRKHNQLGLTPRTEQYESSDEQGDDENEESKLAPGVPGDRTSFQVSYKGQTSTLLSPSDIAAWIEERKKRWPTKARTAEVTERRREQHKEAQEALAKARRERKDRQDAILEQKRQSQVQNPDLKPSRKVKTAEDRSEDKTAKSKRKIAKLQQKLEKEQQRVAKAEARMLSSVSGNKESDAAKESRNQPRIESLGNDNRIAGQDRTSFDDGSNSMIGKDLAPLLVNQTKIDESSNEVDVLTPISQPATLEGNGDSSVSESARVPTSATLKLQSDKPQAEKSMNKAQTPTSATMSDDGDSDLSSVLSSTDTEDMTSSSGSSDSEDDNRTAPEVASSKDHRPERMPPPSRTKSTRICKNFLKGGRCRFGDRCTFKHELPSRGNRGARAKNEARPEARKPRVSLYQRLVDQEKRVEEEQARKAAMEAEENGLTDAAGHPSQVIPCT